VVEDTVSVSVAVVETCPNWFVERVPKVWVPLDTGDGGVKEYGSLSSSNAPSLGTTPLVVKAPPSRFHAADPTLETVTGEGIRRQTPPRVLQPPGGKAVLPAVAE
jgi:hypothetical protein